MEKAERAGKITRAELRVELRVKLGEPKNESSTSGYYTQIVEILSCTRKTVSCDTKNRANHSHTRSCFSSVIFHLIH